MTPRRAIFAAVLLLSPALAWAQAWTPPSGAGAVWLSSEYAHIDRHLQGNGITAHDVEIDSNTYTLGFEYGLSDRLAIGMSLPWVTARLLRGSRHGSGNADNGETHSTATDVRIDLRYKAVDSAFVFTPTLGITIPTHHYETRGHSAPGRGVNEYAAGFDVGYNAIPISPYLFVGGGYQHSFVERIDDRLTVDRSNADLQLDYLLTGRLSLRAATYWQKTHGGLNLPLAPDLKEEHGFHHDQLARANFWRASTGLGYELTPTVELFVAWATVLDGVNTHGLQSWSGGIAWRFDRSTSHRAPLPVPAPISQ